MANLYLLRSVPVNVLRYLPKFLANDPKFKATQDNLSWEHEQYRLKMLDVLKQCFVNTATWGLSDWDEFVGIVTNEKLSNSDRRRNIKLKINSNETSTINFLTQLANEYVVDNSVVITTNNSDYSFGVIFNRDTCFDVAGLENSIETYKPAHLGFKTYEEQALSMGLFFSAIPVVSESTVVEMATDLNIEPISSHLYFDSVIAISEVTQIGG